MVRSHASVRALGVALLAIFSACASDDGGDVATTSCAKGVAGKTADGEAVVICETLHSERPYVRPPSDTIEQDGASTLFLAATDSNYSGFVDREGTMYRTVDAGGKPLDVGDLPESLRAPSKRNLYLIYRVSGTVGSFEDESDPRFSASISITEARPAILIKGKAIDGAFLGPWEGTVSRRADDTACTITPRCWDAEQQVPLRVSFNTLEAMDDIGVLEDSRPRLPDGERFKLVGAVDNMRDAVRSSDGKCIASLGELGEADPFRPSSTGDLVLWRIPAMHTEMDDTIVLEYPKEAEDLGGFSGMSWLNVLHPANLLQVKESDEWSSVTIHNHGVPNGSEINLHPVTGGGGTCTP